VAKILAKDKFDVKQMYKSLKKMEKNKDAFLARLRAKADKSLELSSTVLEGTNGSNT
jgi:hypothetical protein